MWRADDARSVLADYFVDQKPDHEIQIAIFDSVQGDVMEAWVSRESAHFYRVLPSLEWVSPKRGWPKWLYWCPFTQYGMPWNWWRKDDPRFLVEGTSVAVWDTQTNRVIKGRVLGKHVNFDRVLPGLLVGVSGEWPERLRWAFLPKV